MNIKKVMLSKWLIYIYIGLILIIIMYVFLPYLIRIGSVSDDLALNIYAEAWGLFFTVAIFMGILELREWFEWKSVENRVKDRLGRNIRGIYDALSPFCTERPPPSVIVSGGEERKRYFENEMNKLLSGEVKLNEIAKEGLLDGSLSRHLRESMSHNVSRLEMDEERYSRFLGSEVQVSLMNIHDYLNELRLEFLVIRPGVDLWSEEVSMVIGKIMKEIQNLKRQGFWRS